MKGWIRWLSNPLMPALTAIPNRVDAGLEELAEELAEEVEAYAQANAPWDDRTGAAREGLTAGVEDRGFLHYAIVLHHTVDYGIWLEIRWNGQYAIIIPTIEAMGPVVMARTGGLIGVEAG